MICANCHKAIEEDSRYCVWCGHQVGAPLHAKAPIRETHVLLGGLISFVGVVCILAGTVAWAAAGWSKSSYDDKALERLGLGLIVLLAAAIVPYVLLRVNGNRGWARGHIIGFLLAILASILFLFISFGFLR